MRGTFLLLVVCLSFNIRNANAGNKKTCSEGQFCAGVKVSFANDDTTCLSCPAGRIKNAMAPAPPAPTPFTICGDATDEDASGNNAAGTGDGAKPLSGIRTEDQAPCAPCAPGRYIEQTGDTSTAVDTLGPGSRMKTDNECKNCPAGKHQPASGSESCLVCPTGQFVGTSGATACAKCPANHKSATDGATCEACPTGEFTEPGGLVCASCPKGKYTDATTSTCVSCPAGTISDEAGECLVCNTGRYSSAGTAITSAQAAFTPLVDDSDNIKYGLAPNTLCTKCDGYLKIESIQPISGSVKKPAILGGTECIKLGPLQSLEWWHLLLIILASAVLAVVVARYVLRTTGRYTGGVLNAVSGGQGRRVVGSVFGNHPADTDNALEMDKLQPTQSLNY